MFVHLWPHRVKFYCRLLSIRCLIQISVQSVFSMSYAFVLGGNPCGCYVCLCVGCWLSSEITKQTCCFKLIEKLPEELTLPFPSSHPPATTPSPSSPFLSSPSAPRCGCFQPQTPSLTQHLIFSSFFVTSVFHSSPLLFSSYSSLSIGTPLFPWVLAWMATIVSLLSVGMKVGLLYKPGDGLRNGED